MARTTAKWVKPAIAGVVLGIVALGVWGAYEDRKEKPQDGRPAATAGTGGAFGSTKASSVMPNQIGPMRLTGVQEGREAIAQINKLHGHDSGLQAGYIGSYSGGANDASIWIAILANSPEARSLVALMTENIRADKANFTGLQELQTKASLAYSVNGGGQKHYYYQASDKVVWLAVAGPNPDNILKLTLDLLGG